MSWQERLDRLPLVFHTLIDLGKLKAEECLKGAEEGATYIATRTYLPSVGVVYSISFGGTTEGKNRLLQEITQELGSPAVFDQTLPTWIGMWKSPSQEIPKTTVHKVLGEERILAICQEHGLDEKGIQLVGVCLAILRATMGIALKKRLNVIGHTLKDLPSEQVTRITSTVLHITSEFAIESTQSR